VFRLTAGRSHPTGRLCITIRRKVAGLPRSVYPACRPDTPRRRALWGTSVYSCPLSEMQVAGSIGTSIDRVVVVMWDGQSFPAKTYASPRAAHHAGRFFVLLTRARIDAHRGAIYNQAPKEIDGFDREGKLREVQTLPPGGVDVFDCYGRPN
jgi:hypothetical protein